MKPRITLLTIGVNDLEKSLAFYRGLRARSSSETNSKSSLLLASPSDGNNTQPYQTRREEYERSRFRNKGGAADTSTSIRGRRQQYPHCHPIYRYRFHNPWLFLASPNDGNNTQPTQTRREEYQRGRFGNKGAADSIRGRRQQYPH